MADGGRAAAAGLVLSKTMRTLPVDADVVGVVTREGSHKARLKRMRRTVLNCTRSMIRQRRGFRDRWLLLTLTYAEDEAWSASQVRAFFHRMRQWFKRRGWPLAYVWVLELTQRGIPHYHVMLRLGVNQRIPTPDDCGWWPHGMTNLTVAKNAVGYLAKYASKGCAADELPKGARISGNAGLDADGRTYVQFWNLPKWARECLEEIERTRRIKGGVLVLSSGQFLPTPYECIFRAGQVLIIRKEAKP